MSKTNRENCDYIYLPHNFSKEILIFPVLNFTKLPFLS